VLDQLCAPTVPKGPARCYVAAGDFLDAYMGDATNAKGNALGGKYLAEYKTGLNHPTSAARWAWHAYKDGLEAGSNERSRPGNWWTRFGKFRTAINRLTKKHPDIWLTEQGVVFNGNRGETLPPGYSRDVEAGVMRAYVGAGATQLTRQSAQIMRFYYYQLRGESHHWDSGLVSPANVPRNIYPTYRHKTSGH
jgi:hypothetical protein